MTAELRIFQGTSTQAPVTAAIIEPLWILTHRGKRIVKSFAAEIEFAVALVPTVAMNQAKAAKNAAALPPLPSSSQRATMSRGFHRYSPVKTLVAEVVMIPMMPHTVNRIGMNGPWAYCPRGDLLYLVKSGILTAKVAHEPVTDVILLSQSQA